MPSFLVGTLQLSKSARLIQSNTNTVIFFHRVFEEDEETISHSCKRWLFFKNGHIRLLTCTNSTENVNIAFLHTTEPQILGPRFFHDTPLTYVKTKRFPRAK